MPAAIEGVIDTRGHYPRFRPMRIGRWHEVEVLVSDALPKYWRRIDRFEGPHYRRAIIPVRLANRRVPASVYIGRSL